MLAKADHLVVLADDLGGTFGKVESEGGLVRTEVVNVEDELFGKVFRGAPDDPADAGVDLELALATTGGEVTRGGKMGESLPSHTYGRRH